MKNFVFLRNYEEVLLLASIYSQQSLKYLPVWPWRESFPVLEKKGKAKYSNYTIFNIYLNISFWFQNIQKVSNWGWKYELCCYFQVLGS